MNQPRRVTDEMIREREGSFGYPFIRICRGPSPGTVEVQRAKKATLGRTPFDWRIDPKDWDITVRAGTEEELAHVARGRAMSAVELAYLAQTKQPTLEQTEGLLAAIEQTMDAAKAREATIACGCMEDATNARPCTDTQELACQAGPPWMVEEASLLKRLRGRPDACPRKRAWIASRTQDPGILQSRCVTYRIPEDCRKLIVGSKDGIQERPALSTVRQWAAGDKAFLVLCASNQTGKTFAACRWLASRGTGGLFVTQKDLELAMTPDPTNKAISLYRSAYEAPALVIDNIESDVSDAMKRHLEALIVKIHAAGRRCILTTSLSAEDFMAMWVADGAKTGPAYERILRYGVRVEVPTWPR